MKTRINWLIMLGVLIAIVSVTAVQAYASDVTATLDPVAISLGDSAQLTVTISGSDSAQPRLPIVKGLTFSPAGQSSSFQSINGAITVSVSLTYQVTPDRAGTFTIPAIRVPGGGSSQPLTLSVSKTGAAPPPSNLPPPNVQSGAADDTASAKGEPTFLRVVLPKRKLYVGELVPVQIKAYFRAGMVASLNGLPLLSSDAFTLNKLNDKPDQSEEVVGGRSYTVVTWSSALAAVKAGDYSVNLELPVIVRVQERGRRRDPFRDFFGNSGIDDSAFDDFFGGVTEKPMTLRTDLDNVKVMSLPTAERPSDFSGAVGQFEVTSEAAPTNLTVGDPITMRLHVTGNGNFDRVSSRGLQTSADWKTYAPRAQFEPADSAGYGGTKTFEQAIVPLRAGREKVPAITFSYFDPATRQYVTRATTPLAIDVAPGSGASQSSNSQASPAASSSQTSSANPSALELAPNKVETGAFVSTLRPVVFAPWFIAMQGVPVMALITGLFVLRRRERLALDPERTRDRAAQAAVREQLAIMEQALATNSAPAFFTAARQAVQEQLARRWRVAASQVTAAEINERLNGDGNDLRTLFAVADDVVYSGQTVPQAELTRWKDTVIHQLKKLEQP